MNNLLNPREPDREPWPVVIAGVVVFVVHAVIIAVILMLSAPSP